MEEIYLITSGMYGDFQIFGFKETEQEAKKYCEDKNKELEEFENEYEVYTCRKL
jgi:hypothetical protein